MACDPSNIDTFDLMPTIALFDENNDIWWYENGLRKNRNFGCGIDFFINDF